ncbi:HSH2D protein, partial [Atractosteus spatula]|nr:HSH2D protein [Atractosteus spatula]
MSHLHESAKHQEALKWFTEFQIDRVIRNGVVPDWFHGIISRKDAEDLLMYKPVGCFLIRVSESRIGYTLSCRADDRCRHYMIDVLRNGQYIIVGENTSHRSLQDLVDFYRRIPLMPHNELLLSTCGQASIPGCSSCCCSLFPFPAAALPALAQGSAHPVRRPRALLMHGPGAAQTGQRKVSSRAERSCSPLSHGRAKPLPPPPRRSFLFCVLHCRTTQSFLILSSRTELALTFARKQMGKCCFSLF